METIENVMTIAYNLRYWIGAAFTVILIVAVAERTNRPLTEGLNETETTPAAPVAYISISEREFNRHTDEAIEMAHSGRDAEVIELRQRG